MTSTTPKPRAGEHTFTDVAVAHAKELAALRERERELREALELVVQHDGKLTGADFAAIQSALTRSRQ